jgi:glycerol dehydrogenase-like iron-containing ADH family enzyme
MLHRTPPTLLLSGAALLLSGILALHAWFLHHQTAMLHQAMLHNTHAIMLHSTALESLTDASKRTSHTLLTLLRHPAR